jgi:GNAT superfamily N-acetyltransferase
VNDVARLRGLLGQSTRLWAGPERLRIEPTRWSALSGAATIEYNVALCHAATQGQDVARTLEEVGAVGVPAIVMLAGTGLGDAQALVRAGWVCVGSTPFMARTLAVGQVDASVRCLAPEELPLARSLVEEAFGVATEHAAVALPELAVNGEGHSLWGVFERGELCSSAAFVRVQEAIVGWSVATPPRLRGRGYARRLLESVLAHGAQEGATVSLVYATAAGEGLYRALGFAELERWQLWSRPRWMLPPA